MSQIFFSYSRRDSEFVDQLIAELEARGVSIWVDRGEILAGESWRRSIVEAIKSCQVFVIVLSPDSVKSENVTKELTLAEQYDKRVLPLVAKTVEIPPALDYQLAGLHYQTFAEGDYKENFERLVRALIATGIPVHPQPEDPKIETPIIEEPIQRISDTLSYEKSEAVRSKSQPISTKTSENPLTKVPIWLWAGGGVVILIVLLIGLFNLIGGNTNEKPTATQETLIAAELSIETPAVIPTEAATQTLAPSKVVPTPTITPYPQLIRDDFGIAMVLVLEGPFSLGSVDGDPDEKPVVEIYLKSFYIDQFEVTNASYKECVDQEICTPPQQYGSQTRLEYYETQEFANYPVLHVSWDNAARYCEWRGGRLPSEAEWEKAARGPDGWVYPWGNVFEAGRANYCGGAVVCPNEPDDGYQDTAPVDAFARGSSPYGAYQMAGNVNEWVADWYDKDYYKTLGDNTENPLGPMQGQERGIRGGSFGLNTEKIRTTNRGSAIPSQTSEYDGFRCMVDLPGP